MKTFLILSFIFLLHYTAIYSQRQNNTFGSEVFVDIPHFVFNKNAPLPVSVYIHESECNNCNNYLNFINIRFKCASDTQWSPVYVFNNWSYNQYLNLFDQYSINDSIWSEQSFEESAPLNSSEHTILFTADTNFWVPPVPVVNVNKRYFYFNFNVPYSLWNMYLCEDSVVDVRVYVSLDYAYDEEFFFRVFVSHNGMPSFQNWYRGDCHFHSYYTQNVVENGFPLKQSRIAAKYHGLNWITITDHSCDFDNYGLCPECNYERLKTEVQQLNSIDNLFKYIPGIEASILNNSGKTIHALVYPSENSVYSNKYFYDAKGDYEITNINIQMFYDSLKKYNLFCYAAHPFAEGDKLSDMVNGGVWNVSDIGFKLNGEQHSYAGTVICNDLNYNSDIFTNNDSTVLFESLYGFQLWNLWYTLTCTDTYLDPWNTNYLNEPFGFIEVDEFNYLHHYFRLQQNLEVYNYILRKSIKLKNQKPYIKHWQPFIIAGSDAHGSFNFSTTDFVNMGLSGQVENNFLGALHTLTYCPNGMGNNGENVLSALKKGKAILSSGPILIPQISYNSINYTCGDTVLISLSNISSTRLFLTAKTSRIFGNIQNCKMTIITENTIVEKNLNLSSQTTIFYLSSILDSLIYSNINKYIAVYFTLTTQANYSNTAIYKTNNEHFYSITNPIWIKVENNVNIPATPFNYSIYVDKSHQTIYFDSAEAEIVEILDPEGRIIFTSKKTKTINVSMLNTGLYLLRISNKDKTTIYKYLHISDN